MTPHPTAGRVLIVDDNEMNRDMLARRLARHGYSVEMVESAHDLLDRVKSRKVDLVLLDVEMPEVSGLDALKSLRSEFSLNELPVIMVTVKNQSEDVAEALNLGANDYVTKPVDLTIALARIGVQLSNKRALEALKDSEQRYALAAMGANDGLWDWDLATDRIYFSTRWKYMLGYEEYEISDSPEEWLARIHEADRERVKDEIAAHQKGSTPHFESAHRVLHKSGEYRWVLCRGLAVRDARGRLLRMAGSQTDISERKGPDPLTGLPNRPVFMDRLERMIARFRRNGDPLFAVLYLDLDGFKGINDSLGHLAGDQLLTGVASRLEKCLRASDTIARLGGDEFAILLDDLKAPRDAQRATERLMRELEPAFAVGGKDVVVSASVGVALSGSVYNAPDEILRDADAALYRAKSSGKARYEIFAPEMSISR